MTAFAYQHVDVFGRRPFHGNGLVVALAPDHLTTSFMLDFTREMRQFETVFVTDIKLRRRSARLRIFTEDEELDFAGHPILGAAAVLHRMLGTVQGREEWALRVATRTVKVHTRMEHPWIDADMDQGVPSFGATVSGPRAASVAVALGLTPENLHPHLPVQVVGTGLDYLIVPVADGLERCRITHPDFETFLQGLGAKFVYVLDPNRPEGRTWDNAGRVEDVATGSAAGPAAGYLMRYGMHPANEPVLLHQGQYTGRASTIQVRADAEGRLWVGGSVVPVATGRFQGLIP